MIGGIDMKTIEKRAKEYVSKIDHSDDFFANIYEVAYKAGAEKGYIAGATEQKQIDEEVRLKKSDDMTIDEYNREVAFAVWYRKNGKGKPTYSDAIEWARKDLVGNVFRCLNNRNDDLF